MITSIDAEKAKTEFLLVVKKKNSANLEEKAIP